MLTLTPAQVTSLPTLFLIDVPVAESPAMHIRNALMLLSLLKEQSPALWAMNTDLQLTALRATAAVVVLDHQGPAPMAQRQLRTAIEALLAADVDWEVITEVPAACARLLMALFQLSVVAYGN